MCFMEISIEERGDKMCQVEQGLQLRKEVPEDIWQVLQVPLHLPLFAKCSELRQKVMVRKKQSSG